MVAGILLGPTLLGALAPGLMTDLFTKDVKDVLSFLSSIGLSFYLFLVGLELRSLNNGESLKQSAFLTISGFLPPFILGLMSGMLLYEKHAASSITFWTFTLYMGVALSITSIPMLARILQEEKLLNTRLGNLALVSASIDDALAWCFLSVVLAMAQSESIVSGLLTSAFSVFFVIMIFYVIKPLLKRYGQHIQKKGTLTTSGLSFIIILILLAALSTDYIGISSVFGCFVLGLAMPDTPVIHQELRSKLEDITLTLFIPIFFAVSGLNANLLGLFNNSMLAAFLLIILASTLGKYGGCYVMMRYLKFNPREASAFGGLMNARGLMGLIVANIGLSYGIISNQIFSLIVLMSLITTALAMPIYNVSLGRGKLMRRMLTGLKNAVNSTVK